MTKSNRSVTEAPGLRHALSFLAILASLLFSLADRAGCQEAETGTADASALLNQGVKPATDQETVPEVYRLSEDEREFLKYLNPIPQKRISLPHPVPEGYVRESLDNPMVRMPDGTVLTVGDLVGWLFSAGWVQDPLRLAQYPEFLADAIAQRSYYHVADKEANPEEYRQDLSYLAAIRLGRDRALEPVLKNIAYVTRGEPLTEEGVRLEYERIKHDTFRVPFGFRANHIFLMGYERYTTTEEDNDLREIARRIAGSEEAVLEIRVDNDRRERRWVPENQRDEFPYEPLSPGERLLVPMDEAGMERLAGIAQQIIRRLDEGEDFLALAEEFSDTANPSEVITAGSDPDKILPEIRMAIRDTPEGEISPIVRTKHGFQIFKVISKQEESVRPFEEVGPMIARSMYRRERERSFQAFTKDLLTTPLLTINKDLIRETADRPYLGMDTVLATFEGGRDMTFRDLFPNSQARDQFRTARADKRIAMVEEAGVLLDSVYTRYSQDHGITDVPEIEYRLDTWEEYWNSRYRSREWVAERYMESPALIYDFFHRYIDYFRQLPRYDVRLLLRPVKSSDPDAVERAKSELAPLKETIDSEERMIELATAGEETPPYAGGIPDAEGPTTRTYSEVYPHHFGQEAFEAIQGARPGTVIGPIYWEEAGAVALVYLTSKYDVEEPEFANLHDVAAIRYQDVVKQNMSNAYYNSIIDDLEGEIEFLYPSPEEWASRQESSERDEEGTAPDEPAKPAGDDAS